MSSIYTISKNIKRILVVVLIAFLQVACNSTGSETTTEELKTSTDIRLSRSQFESAGMKLGGFADHSFSSTIAVNGKIDVPPGSKASISTFYGGFVKKIDLLPGDKVSKGQVLYMLESPVYVQMQEDFLESKNKLAYLKADFERQQALVTENIASRKNFLKAEMEYNVTVARHESLKKKLKLININPSSVSETNLSSTIAALAPIDGSITEINISTGMYLNPTDVAIEIINSEHTHLELNVFEKDIQQIKEGQPISFRLPDANSTTFQAQVHLVGKVVEEENRIVGIHGHLLDEAQASLFVPGMYIEANIAVDNHIAKALQEEAVINVRNKFYVLVLKKSEADEMWFDKREVVVGKTQNGFIEILNFNEFEETDKILAKGAFNLIQE